MVFGLDLFSETLTFSLSSSEIDFHELLNAKSDDSPGTKAWNAKEPSLDEEHLEKNHSGTYESK